MAEYSVVKFGFADYRLRRVRANIRNPMEPPYVTWMSSSNYWMEPWEATKKNSVRKFLTKRGALKTLDNLFTEMTPALAVGKVVFSKIIEETPNRDD